MNITLFGHSSMYGLQDSREETLRGLLQFWSGYLQLPRDTSCKLWVKYCPEQSYKVLAEAETCTVTLRIPTIHQHYQNSKKFMDCSIAHGKVGFGRMWWSESKTSYLTVLNLGSNNSKYRTLELYALNRQE